MNTHKFKCAWGSYVLYLLDERGWSQSTLADRLSCAPGTVSNYLSGRSKPPAGEMTKWAEALDCTSSERERLLWLVHEPYTPTAVWSRIRELERLLAEAADANSALAREIGDLRTQFTQLVAQLGGGGGEAPGSDKKKV